jgi:predicted RNA-binding Zn-ribbon protein involved in translation (DUF1610 family)
MDEQQVACSACGEVVVVRGLDGDGRPVTRSACPECGAEVDLPDVVEGYYSLACEAR